MVGACCLLKRELDCDGIRSKRRVSTSGRASGGHSFSRGALYKLVASPAVPGDQSRGQHSDYARLSPPIKRRGVEKRLLIGKAAAPGVRIDPALPKVRTQLTHLRGGR